MERTFGQFLKQKRASLTLLFVSSINMETNKVFFRIWNWELIIHIKHSQQITHLIITIGLAPATLRRMQ